MAAGAAIALRCVRDERLIASARGLLVQLPLGGSGGASFREVLERATGQALEDASLRLWVLDRDLGVVRAAVVVPASSHDEETYVVDVDVRGQRLTPANPRARWLARRDREALSGERAAD